MKVLLSIKPEYADKIFSGVKKYEYRRSVFRNPEVKTVVVYASSPIQRVIGEFDIEVIFDECLDLLWEKTKEYSGITENYFYEYFKSKTRGYAIKISKPIRYTHDQSLKERYNIKPPQSFAYLTNEGRSDLCFQ